MKNSQHKVSNTCWSTLKSQDVHRPLLSQGEHKSVYLGFLSANMTQFELFDVCATIEPGFEKVHFFGKWVLLFIVEPTQEIVVGCNVLLNQSIQIL